MQSDELDILCSLTSVLRAVKETNKLSSLSIDRWPTYSVTVTDEDGKPAVYQGQALKNYSAAMLHFENSYGDYCDFQLAWSDTHICVGYSRMAEVHGER